MTCALPDCSAPDAVRVTGRVNNFSEIAWHVCGIHETPMWAALAEEFGKGPDSPSLTVTRYEVGEECLVPPSAEEAVPVAVGPERRAESPSGRGVVDVPLPGMHNLTA